MNNIKKRVEKLEGKKSLPSGVRVIYKEDWDAMSEQEREQTREHYCSIVILKTNVKQDGFD